MAMSVEDCTDGWEDLPTGGGTIVCQDIPEYITVERKLHGHIRSCGQDVTSGFQLLPHRFLCNDR